MRSRECCENLNFENLRQYSDVLFPRKYNETITFHYRNPNTTLKMSEELDGTTLATSGEQRFPSFGRRKRRMASISTRASTGAVDEELLSSTLETSEEFISSTPEMSEEDVTSTKLETDLGSCESGPFKHLKYENDLKFSPSEPKIATNECINSDLPLEVREDDLFTDFELSYGSQLNNVRVNVGTPEISSSPLKTGEEDGRPVKRQKVECSKGVKWNSVLKQMKSAIRRC